MSSLYADLPHLTEAEFDALVDTARERRRWGARCISDRSVAMARAVLIEHASYIAAARRYGGTLSTEAQQAVRVLMRYRESATAAPIDPRDNRAARAGGPAYAGLPRLTPAEFDALVGAARQGPARGGRPISARGMVMARAVLVDGVTYRAAERAQGVGYSVAARAVAALLRYWQTNSPTCVDVAPSLHDPFGRVPATPSRGEA